MALSDRQHRAILDLVGTVNSALGLEEFRSALLGGMRAMIPTDFVSYNEVIDGQPAASLAEPELPAWAYEAWARLGEANPLIANAIRTRDLRPYRWSDVVDLAELRSQPLFTELYEPLGIDHQIAFQLPAPPVLVIGVVLSRGRRDYDDVEIEMLDLARPHLIQAYRSAQLRDELIDLVSAARAGVEAGGVGVAVCTDDTVKFASSLAVQAVMAAGLGELVEGDRLPPALAERSRERVLRTNGEALLMRRIDTGGGETVLIFERSQPAFSREALHGLGLTEREADVLAEFAMGRDTTAAAQSLGIAPGTVHKHSQAIHAKLGVRTRAQAVATAWAAVGAATAITL